MNINTFGTNTVPEEAIERAVNRTFSFKPADIIQQLDLLRPDLLQDHQLRPLRQRRSRYYLGKNRQGQRAAKSSALGFRIQSSGFRYGISIVRRSRSLATRMPAGGRPAAFESSIQPFFAEHCYDCHDTRHHKGSLDLSKFQTAADVTARAGHLGPRRAEAPQRRDAAGRRDPPGAGRCRPRDEVDLGRSQHRGRCGAVSVLPPSVEPGWTLVVRAISRAACATPL